MTTPLPFRWDGEAMIPLRPKLADEAYTVGEDYFLEERQERSSKAHARFFASVTECWHSLPDDLAARFPTPDALRKYALVMTGFRDAKTVPCATRAEALRWAAVVQALDSFAVVAIDGATVTVLTPQSQSYRSMGKKRFHESADAVLEYIATMIGVTGGELARQTEAA